MKYLHAVLILHRSGKAITEKNLIEIFESVGLKADLSRIKVLIDALTNVDIDEVLKSRPIMKAPVKVEPKPVKKKKEKKEEKEREVHGLGKLFD